ncbi:MAG: aspartyl protease family protein [Prolixibacteraceae bacterium]|jgi:predicted aspartyl protease|nr:aspartyl protease family protein [Prolixibacteraceae bacterium]
MKRAYYKLQLLLVVFLTSLVGFVNPLRAQTQINILDQNISILAENEPLEDVIRNICDQFNLDFNYNSKLIKGKRVNLSISNKSVQEILDKLMKDFYLIFEIENNLLVVRDYVPLSEHIDFEKLYSTPSAGFIFKKEKKKKFTIDFKLISNLIIIPVSINGSDTMNFILDTGVRDPIITELTLVEELNLNYMKSIELRGLGNDMITQAYQSGDNTITLPGLSASHQKINVVLDENFQISQILGMPVHGLIGFNLFKHYIIRVNYAREQIKLIKPQFYKYRPRKNDIVLPVTFVRNKPVINAEVVQDNGKVVPVRLLVDTGASDALWLSTQTDTSLKIPEQNMYAFLGSGLGGDLFGHKGRLSGLWLGGSTLSNPIVSYPESEYINNVIQSERRNGSIGGEILRRYTVVFDYYNKRIILRPNSSLKEKFFYNMSGLEIINPVPGIAVYTISNVIENSPAWNAGFRESDQVISINHRNHKDLSLNDINLALRQKQNKKIKLTVLRNGVKIKSTFYLNEIF